MTNDLEIVDDPAMNEEPPQEEMAKSPMRTCTPPPAEPAQEPIIEKQPTQEAQTEVMVTGEIQNPLPETSTVLAKIPAKDESPTAKKGKTAFNFPSFDDQHVDSLHQTFLTRLSKSREAEATMMNIMKKKI